MIYPIGTLYETKNISFNPNTQWGGTWQKIEGKQLIAADGVNYIVGNNYGALTHKHTTGSIALTVAQLAAHTHIQNAHTHIQNAHNHRIDNAGYDTQGGTTDYLRYGYVLRNPNPANLITNATTPTNQNTTATNQNTGGGATHNHGDTSTVSNLFTSVAIIVWERIG